MNYDEKMTAAQLAVATQMMVDPTSTLRALVREKAILGHEMMNEDADIAAIQVKRRELEDKIWREINEEVKARASFTGHFAPER